MDRRLVALLSLTLAACTDASTPGAGADAGRLSDGGSADAAGDVDAGDGPIDLTDAHLTDRAPGCARRVGRYSAMVTDVGRGRAFTASVEITADATHCTIASNGIPNHDFNDGGAFATPVAEVVERFRLARTPELAARTTALSLRTDNGVFLSGVKLDLRAAACYGVGGEPLGRERIGCMADATPWRYDPMFAGNSFGTDGHNAHTQPDGAYHYHGDPRALYDDSGTVASGVIGWAADGFPIYGPWIDDGGTIRRVRSGYTLKAGDRVSQAGEGAFPGGQHDGRFIDDYAFTGGGDLDRCNGMTRDGSYGYYVTDAYPWVVACFQGTPDASFDKR
jgi:hypothetical protein